MKELERDCIFRLVLALGAATFIIALMAAIGGAQARIIIVDENGNGDHLTIQDAINSSENDDTIRVWKGTYQEHVVVNKTLTLIGNDSAVTTIDGGGEGDVVIISVPWVNMSGFTVTGSGNVYNKINAGIKITGDHAQIFDNNCSDNQKAGILVEGANFVSILDNTIGNNIFYGVYLLESDKNLIWNNTCWNHKYAGIILESSFRNKFYSNHLYQCSFDFETRGHSWEEQWASHTMPENNTVNDKPVRYLARESNVTVSSISGQIIVADSSQILIREQNLSNANIGILVGLSSEVIIEKSICVQNDFGISISDSEYCSVRNNSCLANTMGIYLEFSDHIRVENNTCLENSRGIKSYQVKGSLFTGNLCLNNSGGIEINADLSGSSNRDNIISNNTCNGNFLVGGTYDIGNGIYIGSGKNNRILNNTCNFNRAGITIHSSTGTDTGYHLGNNTCNGNYEGIRVIGSENNHIEYCCCEENTEYGIYLSISCGNTFVHNSIVRNEVGLYVKGSFFGDYYSTDNEAHENCISYNEYYGIQVYDNGGHDIEATNNWWGSANGPGREGPGDGDDVSKDVIFDPWIERPIFEGYMDPVAIIQEINPSTPTEGDSIEFTGNGSVYGSVTIFSWCSDRDGELYNGTLANFTTKSLFNGTHMISLAIMDDYGVWSEEATTILHVNAIPSAVIISLTPDPALDTDSVQFSGKGTDDGIIEQYMLTSSINGELYNGPYTTHNVFLELFSSTSASDGPSACEVASQLNIEHGNEFTYVTMVIDDDEHGGSGKAEERAGDYAITSTPHAFFDGGYQSVSGAQENTSNYEDHYRNCGIREVVANVDLSVDIRDNGNGTMEIIYHATYLDTLPFFDAYLRIYIVEKESRYRDIHEESVPYAFIDYAFNQDIRLFSRAESSGTVTWEWDNHENAQYGNYIVIGAMFDKSPGFERNVIQTATTETDTRFSNLSPGTHTISYQVMDDHGIWSEPANKTLLVHQRPVAEIDVISPNPSIEGEAVQFKGSGTDDGSIIRYSWRSDLAGPLNNGTGSSFVRYNLAIGNHTIFLKVQDDLGVWSEEVEMVLEIREKTSTGNQKPTISIISPVDGDKVEGKITIKGSVSDEDGVVERVEIRISQGDWIPINLNGSASWDFKWDTSIIDNGEYMINVRYYDGQVYTDEINITVTVDNTADENTEEEGYIPGFAVIAMVGIILIGTGYYLKKLNYW